MWLPYFNYMVNVSWLRRSLVWLISLTTDQIGLISTKAHIFTTQRKNYFKLAWRFKKKKYFIQEVVFIILSDLLFNCHFVCFDAYQLFVLSQLYVCLGGNLRSSQWAPTGLRPVCVWLAFTDSLKEFTCVCKKRGNKNSASGTLP